MNNKTEAGNSAQRTLNYAAPGELARQIIKALLIPGGFVALGLPRRRHATEVCAGCECRTAPPTGDAPPAGEEDDAEA